MSNELYLSCYLEAAFLVLRAFLVRVCADDGNMQVNLKTYKNTYKNCIRIELI